MAMEPPGRTALPAKKGTRCRVPFELFHGEAQDLFVGGSTNIYCSCRCGYIGATGKCRSGFVGFGEFALFVFQDGAAGHFHAAFFIDPDAFGGDDVAGFDDVFDLVDAGAINQANGVREKLIEWHNVSSG